MRRFLPSAFAWACLPAAAAPLQYNRDIRPILSDKCFACHGFDAKHREADLRLDEPEAAFKADKHGNAAIVPGKPDDSLLWYHITSTDEDEIMPPPESKKALSDAEKATLRRWNARGQQIHFSLRRNGRPLSLLKKIAFSGELERHLFAFYSCCPAHESRQSLTL